LILKTTLRKRKKVGGAALPLSSEAVEQMRADAALQSPFSVLLGIKKLGDNEAATQC
jgi:hypothetical protein